MKKTNFIIISILSLMAWVASGCSEGKAPTVSKPETKSAIQIEIKDRFKADKSGEVHITGKTTPGANVAVYNAGEDQGIVVTANTDGSFSIKLKVQPNSTSECVVQVTKGENTTEKRFVVIGPSEYKEPASKRTNQVKNHENERIEVKAKPKPQPKPTGPSRQELRAFWNRMYELNGMLHNNIEPDGFFAQYEISWVKEVRNQLHSMRVPNDPQAEKYHRMFKNRMDTVWFWIFDGNDDMQAQRILDEWGYESQLLFADEYKHPDD